MLSPRNAASDFTVLPKDSTGIKAMHVEDGFKTLNDFLSVSVNKEDYCYRMEYVHNHLTNIERQTRGQNSNSLWYLVRQHMITALKAHDIKTRMITYKKGEANGKEVDLSSLTAKISGKKLSMHHYGMSMLWPSNGE